MWAFKLLFLAGSILLLVLDDASADNAARISVHGKLLCDWNLTMDSVPISNATVKLMELDDLSFNDQLGLTKSDAEGRFYVNGSQAGDPGGQIEPYIEVISSCCNPFKEEDICTFCFRLPIVNDGDLREVPEAEAILHVGPDKKDIPCSVH